MTFLLRRHYTGIFTLEMFRLLLRAFMEFVWLLACTSSECIAWNLGLKSRPTSAHQVLLQGAIGLPCFICTDTTCLVLRFGGEASIQREPPHNKSHTVAMYWLNADLLLAYMFSRNVPLSSLDPQKATLNTACPSAACELYEVATLGTDPQLVNRITNTLDSGNPALLHFYHCSQISYSTAKIRL